MNVVKLWQQIASEFDRAKIADAIIDAVKTGAADDIPWTGVYYTAQQDNPQTFFGPRFAELCPDDETHTAMYDEIDKMFVDLLNHQHRLAVILQTHDLIAMRPSGDVYTLSALLGEVNIGKVYHARYKVLYDPYHFFSATEITKDRIMVWSAVRGHDLTDEAIQEF